MYDVLEMYEMYEMYVGKTSGAVLSKFCAVFLMILAGIVAHMLISTTDMVMGVFVGVGCIAASIGLDNLMEWMSKVI